MKQSKELITYKYRKKIQHSSKGVERIHNRVNTVSNVVGKSFSFIKRTAMNFKNLVSMGIGLLLITFIVLFIGIFACLSYDSTVNSATEPLSVKVIEYKETIEKYAKRYDMENISLMLQEYNYGKKYITWAQENFGGYTRVNTKVYYDEKVLELQVSNFGDPKYVSHILRYYHVGIVEKVENNYINTIEEIVKMNVEKENTNQIIKISLDTE